MKTHSSGPVRCTCPGPTDRVDAHCESCPSYPWCATTLTKKRYVLWDHPDAGGDDTLLTAVPVLGQDGEPTDWSTDRELARQMTAKQAVKQLQKHDSGYLLRSRLWIVAVEDVEAATTIHVPDCAGGCGGVFKCTGRDPQRGEPERAGKGCGKNFGFCMDQKPLGVGSDDMPEHCNLCWLKHTCPREKTAVTGTEESVSIHFQNPSRPV